MSRLRRFAVPAVVASLIPGAWVATAAPTATQAKARPAPEVARVTQLSGHQLFVQRGKRLVALRRGGRLRLGELVVEGRSTKATIHVKLPTHAGITPKSYVLYISRYAKIPAPAKVGKQIAVIAAGVATHHTIRIEPKLVEFRP